MGNESARRLAILAGNGFILALIAQLTFTEERTPLTIWTNGQIAVVPLIGAVLAYLSLSVTSQRAARWFEILGAVAFVFWPLLWVATSLFGIQPAR